jgi:hypothetical protein
VSGGLTDYLAVWSFGRPGLSGHACLVSGYGHSIAVMAAGPLVGVFVADTRLHNTTINPSLDRVGSALGWGFGLHTRASRFLLAVGGSELTALPFCFVGLPT